MQIESVCNIQAGGIKMEWIERLNKAMSYIEEHITEEIDFEQTAKIACCSAYHFQRMFTYMAGIPLSEYIRRRRMTLAAAELQSSDEKVIDIALKYGYASPTAFNRAFQSVQGITPSAAKKKGTPVKSYPPLSFAITIKGVEGMNYRIEEKEAFRIIGIAQPMSKNLEENFAVVPQMWGKAAADGTIQKLASMIEGQPAGLLGVSICNNEEDWRYFIAVSGTRPAEAPFEEYRVPASTWAVFPGTGTNLSVQDLERRIVTEWLPTSGYEYGSAPDIEVYISPNPENAKYEVWIPVVKKQ